MPGFRSVITPAELAGLLDASRPVVIDCRFDLMDPAAGRVAWQDSRVPGAVYADLDADLAGPVTPAAGRHPLPDPEVMAERFRAMGVTTARQAVVYDDSGGAIASRAWWLLRWLGHDLVAVLSGGFGAWQDGGFPLETGAPEEPACGDLQPATRADEVATTEELAATPAAPRAMRLVDVRDAARFRGEVEPIDPVAGHIPGATNLPFKAVLDDAGHFLSPPEIERLLYECLEGDLESPWTVMCGSGVTACHLAVAAEYAGLAAPRLYVGSFSEWIRDPERAVARGAR